jgi:DNA modification methylase
MIPWRVALALQADGWWLRSVICWHKKSCMPESVTDRPTNSWEPIFLLAKSQRYFYDAEAVKEQVAECSIERAKYSFDASKDRNNEARGGAETFEARKLVPESGMRNQRNVWTLGPEPYSEAHFATFPTEIPRRAILAGTSARGCCPKCYAPWERMVEKDQPQTRKVAMDTPPGQTEHGRLSKERVDEYPPTRTVGWQQGCDCGDADIFDGTKPVPCTVIDPFGGSGTTGAVAIELGRRAILCELNDAYLPLIQKRTNVTKGLALA